MPNIKVAVINSSTVVTDGDVEAVVDPLQQQVHRDLAPVWGVDADLVFVKKGDQPPAGYWWLVVLDDTDQAGDLGYHDLTDEGLPQGKVFAGTDLQYGNKWTVTASHELLEMLVDPAINLTTMVQSSFDPSQNVVGRLYSYEVCDPCESDADAYDINGVLVSDFVYPAWFEVFPSLSTKFDYQNRIRQQFTLLPGGYMQVYDMTSGTGWQQMSLPNQKPSYSARAPVGSRRERRRIPTAHWMKSSPRKAAKP
jgi:hypothetical protein